MILRPSAWITTVRFLRDRIGFRYAVAVLSRRAFFCVTSYQLTPSWTAPLKSAMNGTPSFLSGAYERLAQRIVLDLFGDVHRPTLLW
jgi:hypothetical protein